MVKAQEWLDQNYPNREERKNVFKLELRGTNFQGHLDLRDFVNLKELFCHSEAITSLDLSNCPKLVRILVYRNNISQDLNTFSHLTKLEKLDLGWESGYSNDFYGSLKSLENCKNLGFICIAMQTGITEGLEYVPTKMS